MPTNFFKAKAGIEISYDSSGGDSTYQAFDAALTQNPSIIIFDNQSNVAVTISDDGEEDFKTFAANAALVLDMRANRGIPAEDFTWASGTQFYGKSAAGAGNFYISYIYARA